MRLRRVHWSVLVGLLLSLGLGGWFWWRGQQPAPDQLAAARVLWAARPFQSYRINLFEQSGGGNCEQRFFARDEQITEVQVNRCGRPINMTVTQMFQWIEQLQRTSSACYPGPAICACLTLTDAHAVFDPVLGYPQTIDYEWRLVRNWAHPDYWRHIWWDRSTPDCNRQDFGGEVHMQVQLVPDL